MFGIGQREMSEKNLIEKVLKKRAFFAFCPFQLAVYINQKKKNGRSKGQKRNVI